MKRIIRLTESDLTRIVRRVINEQSKAQVLDATVANTEGRIYVSTVKKPTITVAPTSEQLWKDGTVFDITFPGFEIMKGKAGGMETIKLTGRCASKNMSPFNLGTSIQDARTGPYHQFANNGYVGVAIRDYCKGLGVDTSGSGFRSAEVYINDAKSFLS